MHTYSADDGRTAVRLARAVVDACVKGGKIPPFPKGLPPKLKENAGVFTTLSQFPSGLLRGCVGFAEPVLPLVQAIAHSARAAALEDGRFDPVVEGELPNLTIEVSLLTPPAVARASTPKELVSQVQVGRHGLIARAQGHGGLLLPQVATEQGWNVEEFLSHTCAKGGFDADAWRTGAVKIFTFEAEIFSETAPRGEIERHGRERPAAAKAPRPDAS